MKKVLAVLSAPLIIASTFFPILAEEEDPTIEYIKVDIPSYSYNAFQFWFKNGYSRFYIPLDDNGDPLYNSSGISATERVNITSTQANSTYTETDTYNLTTTESGNIRGSLYAQGSTGSPTNYTITTGAGAAVGNLPYTSTGTIKGTETATGTIVNGNITSIGNCSIGGVSESQITYIYDLPWLEGTYTHSSAYSSTNNFQIYADTKYYLAFYCDRNLWQSSSIPAQILNYYVRDGYSADITATRKGYDGNGIYYYVVTFSATNYQSSTRTTYLTIDFPRLNSDSHIIPMYFGTGIDLSDDQKTMFNITTNLETTIITENNETQTLMTSGDSTSQTSENHVNSTNNNLTNKVNSLESYESSFNSDLNNSLNNITLPNVGGVVKFGNAARWVSAQFTRIANDQRINFPLIFCLTLGLALTILGRIRT